MTKRKARRAQPPFELKLHVRLTEGERTRIGFSMLGLKDGHKRRTALADAEQFLGRWAQALANVPDARLRSDLVAQAQRLAARALTFWGAVQRAPDTLSFAKFEGFIDVEVLRRQLSGFESTLRWIQEEKARRGGERRSFRKQKNDEWKQQLSIWFDEHAQRVPKGKREVQKAAFVRLVQRAVERAVKSS